VDSSGVGTAESPAVVAGPARRRLAWLRNWSRRVGLSRKLAIALAVAAVASGIATYVALTREDLQPEPGTVLLLLNVDLILLLLLGAVVARRLVEVWAERRRGSAGSKLHVRLVVLFSAVAVAPAIVVALFSALFFNLGVQAWFSDRVRTSLAESLAVAEAYLDEHRNTIRADILAMAGDLSREGPVLLANPRRFQQIVMTQAALRALPEVMVFDGLGRVLMRAGLTLSLEFATFPIGTLERAREGELVMFTPDAEETGGAMGDRVRALVRVDGFDEVYLLVGRYVEPKVVAHVERTREAVAAYESLEGRRSIFEITFAGMFVVVALLLLLAAVWVGLTMATRLALPIGALIAAAERVRAGDLAARVAESEAGDELGSLSRAFNRMTSQISAQQGELLDANRQLDHRRRFTEAVLAGVSAGVVGLDAEGRITLPNGAASTLLGLDLDHAHGAVFADIVPEMAGLLSLARQAPERLAESEITIHLAGDKRTLFARVTSETRAGANVGFVVTFDDVTELQGAQRKAAWADVARRIAHEIKNPLTPIQLSAERLRRKYLEEIKSDPDTFRLCTETIERQVGDIGRMVDEFSSFARMPAPVLRPVDLGDLVRQTVFLHRNARTDITFTTELPAGPSVLNVDHRQIGQALTNLLRNAVDAIDGRDERTQPGRIGVTLALEADRPTISVADNGKGLPREGRDRLTEPYVTTRAKGTGLGLAIVKKIMEDHAGRLELGDRDGGGAVVRLVFARVDDSGEQVVRSVKAASHGA
jgi:two-component system nitrogen regulation sensor histidine kinase NtrY